MLFYYLLWSLVLSAAAPALVLGRPRRLRERTFPPLGPDRPAPGSLWVHALSVGEVLSAVPLVKGMAARFADRDLAFTATTGQGMKVAEKELGGRVRSMAFMPLDYPLFYARVVGFFRPSVFILVETDLWPGLLFYLRRMRIPAVVVNGRISPRTFRRYHRVRPLGRVLLGAPLKWLVQSEPDRMRLLSIGLPEEMVSVVGNIKFDTDPPPLSESERLELARSLGLEPAGLTWVAGSTHQGEEEVILEVLSRLQGRFPHLKLVLAPRRVERVADVEASASAMGFRTARRSGGEEEKAAARVVVVDTLGELQKIYSLATVAFVGGSLAPVGGHNLLEPGRWGKPVIFGPHIHNFETMAELLIEAGGGRMVRNPAELEQAVSGLLDDGVAAREMGCRAGGFVRSNQGAVDRVLDEIEGLLGP